MDIEYDQVTTEQLHEQSLHEEVLDRCFARLANSPNARAMINEAHRSGWRVSLNENCEFDFQIDVKKKEIVLSSAGMSQHALANSDYFQNMITMSLVRALRDVWQERRHGDFNDQYGPEHVLMLERVRAADGDVLAVLIAWELRSEGQGDLWRHVIGSDEGDVAMAFSGYLERDSDSAFSFHEAMRAAFKQWYRCAERVNSCDHEALDYLDSLLEEHKEEDVFGSERLTPVGLEVLSCLPDKTAYLQGMGREILMDPFYAGLDSSINQAHFTQIMHDLRVVYVQGVPFRDKALALKIFPEEFLS